MPCFSIHSSARLSPRLPRLPPRSTEGFRGCCSQRSYKKHRGGGKAVRKDRKADPLGLSGGSGFAQPQGGRRMSLGFRRWSLSETGPAFCLSLVCCHGNQIFQPSIWGRLSFAGGRWCALFSERKRGFFLRARLRRAGNRTPGFYSRHWQRVSSSCGWSPNWYVCL